MAIQREVILTADDSQLSSVMERASQTIASSFESAASGVDRTSESVSSVADTIENKLMQVEQSAKDLFQGMVTDSERYGKSVQDRLSYLQQEVTLIERASKEEAERAKLKERLTYEEQLRLADAEGKPEFEKDQLQKEYQRNVGEIDSASKVDQLQTRKLREEYEQYRNEIGEDEGTQGGGRRGRGAGIAGGAFATATGAAGFGAILSLSGFIAKAITEGEQQAKARGSFLGLYAAGEGANLQAGVGGSFLGMKEADFIRYSEGVAKARGGIRGVGGAAREQFAFEKGFSLETGALSQLAPALRAEGRGRDAGDIALEMLNMFKKSDLFGIGQGDFTLLAEKLDFGNQMNADQAQQMEKIDATTSAQIMRAFGIAGVDDNRLMSFTSTINQAITNPQDEFSNAIALRALRKSNPNASLLELQEQQEQGIYGQGNFSAILNQLRTQFSGDLLIRSVSNQFGLKLWQARKVVESGEDFSGIGRTEQIDELFTKEDVRGRGGRATTPLENLLADFNTTMAGFGEKGLRKVGEYAGAFKEGGFEGLVAQIGSDIKDAIVDGFTEIKERMFGEHLSGTEKTANVFKLMGQPAVAQGIEAAGAGLETFATGLKQRVASGEITEEQAAQEIKEKIAVVSDPSKMMANVLRDFAEETAEGDPRNVVANLLKELLGKTEEQTEFVKIAAQPITKSGNENVVAETID